MGRAQSDTAPMSQQRLHPSGGQASEDPGTVATAARRIVATSEGGGCPSRQSRPERPANNAERPANYQFSFMLPLEVMGPGGSLSTVLIATPNWRDASRRVSWQAATATAAYSCDRTTTELVHRLGSGWRQQRRRGPVSSAMESNFVYLCDLTRLNSAL
jgi:hypothetical protein